MGRSTGDYTGAQVGRESSLTHTDWWHLTNAGAHQQAEFWLRTLVGARASAGPARALRTPSPRSARLGLAKRRPHPGPMTPPRTS